MRVSSAPFVRHWPLDGRRQTDQAAFLFLQPRPLLQVALATENLQVVHTGGSAAAERNHMIELQIVDGSALAALAAVALIHLCPDVRRDRAGITLSGCENQSFGDAQGALE